MDKHVSDLDAERLFAGVSDPDPAEPLTRFTADLRATYVATPAEPTRAAHLHAMTETYAGLVGTGQPKAAPAKRRRRFVVRGTIAAAGLVLVGGSAMAATGTLPDAAQDAVSSVARRIGVQLPRAKSADIRIVHPDIDRSDIRIKKVANEETSSKNDDDDDRVSTSDDDNDSIGSLTDSSGREPRRPRRDPNDGGTTVIDDGGSSTPDEPSSDGGSDGGIDDGRGDPSGDGGGSTDPDPGDGGGSTDPDPDDGGIDDGGGGRGDPKDGSSPSGADAGANEPADPGPGAG
jgi:hypothetical protein